LFVVSHGVPGALDDEMVLGREVTQSDGRAWIDRKATESRI
jgi:hypothetical protein